MPVAIKNLTLRPVYVPLNSGTNLRLSPGEMAEAVEESELKDNPKIEKLRNQRAISVESAGADASRKSKAEKSADTTVAEEEADDSRAKPRKKG